MNVILFDDKNRDNLLPLTYTRPSADLRVGILTIREKWEKYLNTTTSSHTQDYLATKYPLILADENLFINGTALPTNQLVEDILSLKPGEALLKAGVLMAAKLDKTAAQNFSHDSGDYHNAKETATEFMKISYPYHIFSYNGDALEADYKLITAGRQSQPISKTNQVMGAENIFLEEGAIVECAILNATTGPIYIGKHAEIMEGSVVRGALALCEHAQLKLSTKIYGPTTLGPYCKVGGEVNNSVLQGYSNKGHDGFLGNSVIGEWCNLGADTNNSNLKNNYAEVKLWDYATGRFAKTGLQFCGLIMGDHSKCGINTMFNTGTVVGVAANIFGAGFPRNMVPSFAWGGAQGFETYQTDKFFEVAEVVAARRDIKITDEDKKILENIFNQSAKYRYWETK